MFKRNPTGPVPKTHVDTLLARNTRINGDVFFGGGLHLDGAVTGNVRAADGTVSVLIVSEEAAIEGSVEVPHVILHGTVNGDVMARERIELGAKARVNGNVYYGVIEMATGAQINGKLIHQPLAAPQSATATEIAE